MSRLAQKIKDRVPITERITFAIWEKRQHNLEPKYVYIGRHDYYDLKQEMEPYMRRASMSNETETYSGIELVVVDRERFLDVGI